MHDTFIFKYLILCKEWFFFWPGYVRWAILQVLLFSWGKLLISRQCVLFKELHNDCSSMDGEGTKWHIRFLTHCVCSQAPLVFILFRTLVLRNEGRSRVPFHNCKVNYCTQRAFAIVAFTNAYQVLKGIHLLDSWTSHLK